MTAHEVYLLESRQRSKDRRDRNRAEGRCINSTYKLDHGPATHGVLCRACRAKHRKVDIGEVQP